MSAGKVAAIASIYVVVAVGFYFVGRATAPVETSWAEQHVNLSRDPSEFRNSVHGLTVRAPSEGAWWMLWQPRAEDDETWEPPEFKMPLHAGVNKVVEIERKLDPNGSDRQWARMDVYVEPLYSSGQVGNVLRTLEFRQQRRNLKMEPPQAVTIGGKSGKFRVGTWSVSGKKFAVVNYWVEHRSRLFVFSSVTVGDALDRFLPVFNEIVSSVRLR